jgi:hypothetical protein
MLANSMSRINLFVAIFFMAVLALPGPVNAADFSADMVQKSPMGTMKGKAFFKGSNFRQEMNLQGRKQVTIFRKDKGVVWVLMPEQMMYMEMPTGSQQNTVPVDPDELEEMGTKKYLGKEKINGYMCAKYLYTPNDPSIGTATYWISEKLNFPIKIESDGPSGNMVMEYRNIDEKTVSDALFEIPSGYQKMSMPMMPGMPGQ